MSRVLRFARSDKPHEFILLHVVKLGSAPLELALTATEGNCPYTVKVQESHIKKLRAKNYQGSDEEWLQIITHVLGQDAPGQKLAICSGVETSISLIGSEEENKEMVLTIRQRVQSITNDEQEIELFEWSGLAAARVSELEGQVIDLTERHSTAEETVQKLKRQLEELTRAKAQHEAQLVANFVQLLNEKKLKIRNQQRLLASATGNPTKVSEIQAATAAAGQELQSTKRNAHDMSDADNQTEEDLEQMDIEQEKAEDSMVDQDTDAEDKSTPQMVDEGDTTTDDESENLETAQLVAKSDQTSALGRSSTKKASPPPRRALPFARREPPAKAGSACASSEVAGNSAGETDDDEL
ncbi:hypothetical protein N7466_004192 [Penicillium verhagenii]|uniref:uncharacterized protein n=1 Tax=Penicillium verhagenii TaxID=1562060 RepID=UPI0025455F69|nr:uncharacterized protein N7466_004192 [Penicillium verhagenii]KAJ5934645.1 hypothetical protein N7466_004192 [Penicillium verhagenii]